MSKHAFGCGDNFNGWLSNGCARAQSPDYFVNGIVVTCRVVVRQCHRAYACILANTDHIFTSAVTPPDLVWIFFGRVLGIVHNQIGIRQKIYVAAVVSNEFRVTGGRDNQIWLVIAAIGNRCAVGLKAVPQRQPRMIQVARRHLYIIDLKRAFQQIVVADFGTKLLGRYRKISVLHLAAQGVPDALMQPLGAINVPLPVWRKKRCKKRDALNVVPVRMTDEKVAAFALTTPDQFLSQRVRSRSAIDDD